MIKKDQTDPNARGLTSGRSRSRQKAKKTIGKTPFCDIGETTPQNLIKPVVYEGFSGYFDEKGVKSLKKHYIYNVSVMRIAGAE